MRYLKFRVRLTATHPGGHVAWQMRRLTGIAPGGGVFGDPWATSGHSCISERDMTAFDPVSGRVLWQQSLGNGGFISGASSNTAQGLGVLLVGTGQDCVALLGVQVATGRVPWTAKLQASTAQKLGRDGSYQLGIVGSTVAFPKPRGIFVCQLKDGSGGRMRGVNTVYPHSSLLVEPGGTSALLAASGVVSPQGRLSGHRRSAAVAVRASSSIC